MCTHLGLGLQFRRVRRRSILEMIWIERASVLLGSAKEIHAQTIADEPSNRAISQTATQ